MFRIFLAGIFLILIQSVNGQQLMTLADLTKEKPDYNAVSEGQLQFLNSLYVQKVDIADELINGREYIPYYFKVRVKPLLADQRRHTGSLIFNGRKYNHLNLEYDTNLDQLIYSDSTKLIDDKIFNLALNKDPVDGFGLYFENDSMNFRHFRAEGGSEFNLPEGFYEVVYEGNSKYITRHQSFLVEKDGMYEYRYTPSSYISTGGRFSKVKSSGSFIKSFGSNADAVRKFMRTNRVHFRSAGKNEIATVLRYYDTLVMSNK